MRGTLRDLVLAWSRWPAALTGVLATARQPADRAAALAELARELTPGAALAACRLDGATGLAAADGAPAGPLRQWLDGLAPGTPAQPCPAPPGVKALVAPVEAGPRRRGLLLVAPARLSAPLRAPLQALLATAGQTLALALERDELRADREELADLVTLGEATASLVHDLNNHLNSMVLQAAAVQLQIDDPQRREDLAAIRREGARAATLLWPLQQFRERRRGARPTTDLNAAVRAALAEAGPADLGAADPLPPVTAHPGDLRRLVALVLRLAAAWHTAADRPPRLRTCADAGAACLRLETDGTECPAEPADLFDPRFPLPPGVDELERLALRSLLRQTGGELRLAGRSGGLEVVVTWPTEAGEREASAP